MPAWLYSNFKIQSRNKRLSVFSISILTSYFSNRLSENSSLNWANASAACPRYFSFFLSFSFCHNKAGGTCGDTSGVRDSAWLTEQGYSTLFWLVALICQWWKQELSVPSGRACKQKGWVGGGTRPFTCVHTYTNIHTVAVKLQV